MMGKRDQRERDQKKKCDIVGRFNCGDGGFFFGFFVFLFFCFLVFLFFFVEGRERKNAKMMMMDLGPQCGQ